MCLELEKAHKDTLYNTTTIIISLCLYVNNGFTIIILLYYAFPHVLKKCHSLMKTKESNLRLSRMNTRKNI